MEFGNGRRLLAFSRDGVLYTFSGSRVRQPDAAAFVLTVDMIRIASEKVPERECVVRTPETHGSFTSIDCNAVSRGRNERYKFSLGRRTDLSDSHDAARGGIPAQSETIGLKACLVGIGPVSSE